MNEDLARPCDACGKPIGGGFSALSQMQDLLLLVLWSRVDEQLEGISAEVPYVRWKF